MLKRKLTTQEKNSDSDSVSEEEKMDTLKVQDFDLGDDSDSSIVLISESSSEIDECDYCHWIPIYFSFAGMYSLSTFYIMIAVIDSFE